MPKPNFYWFLLGREPLLSLAELKAALPWPADWDKLIYAPPLLIAQGDFGTSDLIRRLGGTIKIGAEVGANLSEQELIGAMVRELETVEGKINFGISAYGEFKGENLKVKVEEWGKQIKKQLKEKNRSVRYVFNKEATLSSVTVSKNGLDKRGREFMVTQITRIHGKDYTDSSYYAVAKTLAVQPFEEFSSRDYGRPGRDDASGMLPPKLAMMMLNIAGLPPLLRGGSGGFAVDRAAKSIILLDPFCGSGTILTEALLLGYKNLIGSDISEKAIEDTNKNVAWIQNTIHNTRKTIHNSSNDINIFQSDVLGLFARIPAASIDVIVTEPYLGPPLRGNEVASEIKKTCLELAELYTNTFAQFKKFLKPKGTVVFIIPRFKSRDTWFTISDKILPEIEKLGFRTERLLPVEFGRENYLLYHRPGQYVGREIWKFRF